MKLTSVFAAGVAVFSLGCTKTPDKPLPDNTPESDVTVPVGTSSTSADQSVDRDKEKAEATTQAQKPAPTSKAPSSTQAATAKTPPAGAGSGAGAGKVAGSGSGDMLVQPPSLAVGTSFVVEADSAFSSKPNQANDTVTATVMADVKDGQGRIVIPAGASVKLALASLFPKRRGDSGTVVLHAFEITIDRRTHPIDATSTAVERSLLGQGIEAGDFGARAASGTMLGTMVVGRPRGPAVGTIEAVTRGVRIVLTLNTAFPR